MMTDPIISPSPTEQTAGSGSVQMPLTDRILTTDVAGDFSLPDYQPEIKRLLRINTSCLPPTRYAGGGAMELSGSLDYFVLYMGNDDQLYCAPLSSDYRMTVPTDPDNDGNGALSEPLVCVCDMMPDAAAGRVTAPRRLNIRCRLKAHVKIYGERSLTCADENGLVPGSVEQLEGHAQVGRLYQGTGELLELQDDMILSPTSNGIGGEARVICAEGQVMVTEATAGSDMINCRGEVTVKLTLCPAEQPPVGELAEEDVAAPASILPSVVLRKIPFSQAVDMPGVSPDCDCCAHGVCSSLSVQVEDGHLHVDVGVILEALAQRNEAVSYTRDLYSTRTASECRYATYTPQTAVHCLNGNFTLSDSQSLSEAGIEPSARVVDVVATATPEELICDKGRYILIGTCRCQLLLHRQGEYSNAELTLPFRYETNAPCDGGDAPVPAFDGHISVVNCRVRMDGERVGIDAELAVCLRLSGTQTLTALSGMSFGPDITHRRGEYVICFPAPTDTLWSVAKRYHAPLTALSAANSLAPTGSPDSPDALDGVKYLIV